MQNTEEKSVEIHAGEDHIDADYPGTEVVHQVLLGKAAAHHPGGHTGHAFCRHDGQRPVEQGPAHALVAHRRFGQLARIPVPGS